jgi:hypothetical protein
MPEQVGITVMRRDVVGYLGSSRPTVSQAHDAEGLLLQLLLASRVPASVVVELGVAAVSAHGNCSTVFSADRAWATESKPQPCLPTCIDTIKGDA